MNIITLSVLKVTQIAKATKLPFKRKYPPNKNCETQPQFFSTKKKRITTTSSSRRPSREEADECKQSLMKIETVFCGIFLQEEDKLNTQDIRWVQRYQCLMWGASVLHETYTWHLWWFEFGFVIRQKLIRLYCTSAPVELFTLHVPLKHWQWSAMTMKSALTIKCNVIPLKHWQWSAMW